MAYLDRQRDSFASSLAAAAAKIPVKQQQQQQQQQQRGPTSAVASPLPNLTATPASPSPSVASTTTSVAGTTPKKNRTHNSHGPAAGTIYSQPDNTGMGTDIGTNLVYALDYLKQQRGKAISLANVLGHLSLNREPEAVQKKIVERMRMHPRIAWRPDPDSSSSSLDENWKTGAYEHNPIIPGVRDRTSLLQFLQRRTDAQGVSVKDLKDGWPDCEPTLAALEKEHRVLVVRTKKDNHPRMVWLDDPSLCHGVEPEFQALWHRAEIPPLDDIVRKLTAAGQKPTSEDPRLRAANQPKEKKAKKKAQRRTGKSTNTHMEHLLKDYSHMKR